MEQFSDETEEQTTFAMDIYDFQILDTDAAYQNVIISTSRDEIECRYYPVADSLQGVIWVAGAGGGWHSPANNLYPHQSEQMQSSGIASLWIKYRYATIMEEAILDVLAGLSFLYHEGIRRTALVRHSLGGAVVIEAGVNDAYNIVKAVVTLATQSYGADQTALLPDDCALLLLHGDADHLLELCIPARSSAEADCDFRR